MYCMTLINLCLFHSFYSACLQNILSGDMWMPRCLVINFFSDFILPFQMT